MSRKTILKNIYLGLRSFILRSMPIKKTKDLKAQEVENILAIRIDRIGDLIISLPALKLLRQIFPKAKISVLVSPGNAMLLDCIFEIDEVISYPGFVKTARLLRKKNFDLVVDLLMDYPLKTALLAYFCCGKFSAGFDVEGRGHFFNLALTPSLEKKQLSKHLLDLILYIAKFFHIDVNNFQEIKQGLLLSEQNKAFACDYLRNNQIKASDIIFGLHPGGKFPSQRWLLESFIELAQKLGQRFKAKIIILGSSQEEKLIRNAVSLMKKRPLLAVGFPLDKLAALIAKMDILICNNSGPLHIAAALNIPTVSTMGPTDPDLWWPDGKEHIVIRRALPCSPCELGFCKSHDCMKLISVEEMEKAVEIQMQKISEKDKIDG